MFPTYIEVELLEGPGVGLGDVLAGGRDVGLRDEQTAQPHLQVLEGQDCTREHMGQLSHCEIM